MKKLIIGIVVVLTIVIVIVAVNKKENITEITNGKPTVKIGVSLPLTGDAAHVGQDYKNAIVLKVEELSKMNTKYNYELIIEDDQIQAKKEVLNAQKLINVNNVDVFINFAAGGVHSTTKLAERKEVIYFDFTWGDEIIKKNKYTFHHFTNPCDMNKKLLKKSHDLGYRKFSILSINHIGAQYSINCFKDEIKKYKDMEIIDEQILNSSERNFELLVKKMDAKNPDVYLVNIVPPILEIWAKELKIQNISTPLVATTAFSFSNKLELFNGSFIFDNAYPSKNYLEKFKTRYDNYPSVLSSVFVYDVIGLISSVYEKYDVKPERSQVMKDLLSIKDYNSEVGKISVNEYGGFKSEPSVSIIRNGKIELLEE